ATPDRSLNVHVRISFDGFHSVASPGRYWKVLGSRVISESYTWSHRHFSDWLVRQANGVSMPHCPTATTRGSPAADAREARGAGRTPPPAAHALRLRNVRRSTSRAMLVSSALGDRDLVTSAASTPGTLRPAIHHVKPTGPRRAVTRPSRRRGSTPCESPR